MAKSTALTVVAPTGEKKYPRYDAQSYEMPEIVKSAVQRAGTLAARHLVTLLDSDEFHALPVGTRMRIIESALNRAYGSVNRAPTFTPPPAPSGDALRLSGMLKRMAEAGDLTHPEMEHEGRERVPVAPAGDTDISE